MEKLLIFVVFLGPLIFFHELGHFFFARLFGVRVEVFSIGFGPKLFKYVKNGTQYAISAIPLGGYVKMFGDDPFSETPLTEEEKKVAFNTKSKWARFWIVFGGPLANIILAYFLYVGLLAGGEKVPEIRVGSISEKSVFFEKGLRPGDVLIGVNDEKVQSFDDFNIKSSTVETIKVRRGDSVEVLSIGMGLEPFIQQFVQSISPMRKPVFVDQQGNRFYLSPVQNPASLEHSVEQMNSSAGTAYLYAYSEDNDGVIDPQTERPIQLQAGPGVKQQMRELGYFPSDLSIRKVVDDSPAAAAGIQKGDIIDTINGKELKSFDELRSVLQEYPEGESIRVGLISGGQPVEREMLPKVQEVEGQSRRIIGIESSVQYVQPKLVVAKAETLGAAFMLAFNRTWDGVQKTFGGYKKLITREVSLSNIGGPVAIARVASDSFNISLSMFFRLMAIISINLAVINLFPIPVLDGGHIMFLLFETVNGGPLSRRKLEIAQRFGLSILFFLIFVALFNDFTR
jgi:regulator of sigma E protease